MLLQAESLLAFVAFLKEIQLFAYLIVNILYFVLRNSMDTSLPGCVEDVANETETYKLFWETHKSLVLSVFDPGYPETIDECWGQDIAP